MKFVITGHRGLIGNFLLQKLEEMGHKAVLKIDAREGKDILDIQKIKLDEKADLMIHLAAICRINKTIENPELSHKINANGTFEVLEFCRKNGIKKIIYTSSSRVLSNEKNPYTASKIYSEELAKAYSQCYGIDYIIIRPSTVYGPFDDLSDRLINKFIINALTNKDIIIFGDKNKTLDFTYIDDFIEGFLLAMKQKNREFDISSGKETRVLDVAKYIIEKTKSKSKIFFKNAEIAQPQQVKINIEPMKKIGYNPKTSIWEGIDRTISWYQKNIHNLKQKI
jgi:UDP-glucose 4-epimerase